MPIYISNEKRNDIIFHKQNGKNNHTIAEFMRVCVRTVERVWADFKINGKSESKVHNCGRKSVITFEQKDKIVQQINNTPDITLSELIEKLGLKITEAGLSKYLKKMDFTYKKRRLIQRNKIEKMCKKDGNNG